MTRRRNLLALLVPTVAAGILALGWLFSTIPDFDAGTGYDDAIAGPADIPAASRGFGELFATGVHLMQVGRAREAAQVFEQARALRPTQPEVYVNLGYALLAAGEFRAAEAAFRTALEYRPDQVNAYFGWAESLEAAGDLEAALGAMRTYIHLTREDDPFLRRARSAVWEWSAARDAASAEADGRTVAPPRTEPLRLLEGGLDSIAEMAGKVTILNVWATWCPPCRAELPSLQRLADSLDPSRFAVIGVSVDEDADFVREFLDEVAVSFPNYLDADRRVVEDELGVDSYPQTFLIGADGSVAERIVGVREWAGPGILAQIRSLAESGIQDAALEVQER